jgi:hypothetical protein
VSHEFAAVPVWGRSLGAVSIEREHLHPAHEAPKGGVVQSIQDIQARMGAIEARFTAVRPVIAPAASAPVSTSGDETTFSAMLMAATGSSTLSGVGTGVGTTATPTGVMTTAQGTAWANDLLSALGMPRTAANIKAITAWVAAEGTKAGNNPLATTQVMPGATAFNSVGVRNYSSYNEGLAATVRTLRNGRYGNILSALATGTDSVAVAQAVADSPWGTGEGVLRRLGVAPIVSADAVSTDQA